jgi:feruloyl esterase
MRSKEMMLAMALACAMGKTAAEQEPQDFARCNLDTFASFKSDAGVVRAAEVVQPGSAIPSQGSAALTSSLPGYCKVLASVTPTKDSLINFEVWIPFAWNGKVVVTGNGGYSNVPSYPDMARALQQGYAAIGGDTGHQAATPDDLLWGAGHPEQIADWGSRSIHAIADGGKRIINIAKRTRARRAYFYGCSTGGHQGYAELQRYPQDFDGVIAGAPGNNRVRLNVGFLWQFLANHQPHGDATPILPASKLPLITKTVIQACDVNDGVVDGIVDDPRSCRFDPVVLECNTRDEPGCLTREQIGALNKMYGGAKNPRTGEQIYPGWPKGSEAPTVSPSGMPTAGWQQYWGTSEPVRANFWRYWVFNDPKWDWWSFDFDRQIALADEKVGHLIDQVSPDLGGFRLHGGKAIVYHGWQDPVTNALDTIAYYEKVQAKLGAQATDSFFRVFMVPGMGHCSGGTGTTNFGNQGAPSPVVDAQHDLLTALDAWVERGVAPDRVVASRLVDGATVRTRPLCRYPQKAVYVGHGSTDDAANFECR